MSEYNFKGIKPESIELLCLNRFNDSKEFYEEHKLELKEGITVPMRQIVLDLSGLMYDIDNKMLTDPVRSVSRIYRDTRGNRSKIKYRENMWLMLRRYKKEYPSAPFFYFEFYPNSFGYGLAFWTWKQSAFKEVHNLIIEHPGRWLDAVDACKQAGLTYNARDNYKKDMYPNAPKEVKQFMSAKNMEFSYSSFDMNRINSPSLIDELKLAFDLARPMYSFWADAYDNMLDKGIIKPEDAIR